MPRQNKARAVSGVAPNRVAVPSRSRKAASAETSPKAAALPQNGQILANILRDQMVPVIQKHGVSRVLLGREHIAGSRIPEGVTLSERGSLGPGVRPRGRSLTVLERWPKDEMEAPRFPCLGFVYGGEADIAVGDSIVHCPAGHLILIPPGVPMTSGANGHWYRPDPEKAYSDIFWMQPRPFGAECHTCHTRGLQHLSGGPGRHFVVPNRHLLPLAEQLVEELSKERSLAATIASLHLLTLLSLLQRQCGDDPLYPSSSALHVEEVARDDLSDPQQVIKRARQHIESNLGKYLTLEIIARSAYVSRARLAQLFKTHLKQTVWEYVIERRLAEAKSMLAETDLNINEISRLAGFNHPSHFFDRFAQRTGMSPGEFRRASKSQVKKSRR